MAQTCYNANAPVYARRELCDGLAYLRHSSNFLPGQNRHAEAKSIPPSLTIIHTATYLANSQGPHTILFDMSSFRVASRLQRNLRVQPILRQLRHESTNSSSSSSNGGISPGVIGGLVGGGLVFVGGYTYYHFSGKFTIEVSIGPCDSTTYVANRSQVRRP